MIMPAEASWGPRESEASGCDLGELPMFVPTSYASGADCFCPVCETHIDDFQRGGAVKKRARARCPNCGVLERHRLMVLYLRAHTSVFYGAPQRVLHVAPEKAVASLLSDLPSIEYVSANLSRDHATLRIDLAGVQYADDSFDMIICSHALQYIADDVCAMKEMFRVLSPNGVAVVQVPVSGETTYEDFSVTSDEARLEAFGHTDHVRRYGLDLTTRLASVGFDVRKITLPLDKQTRHRLGLKSSPLFDCRKPGALS